jgi:hypothetical protein
MKDWVQFQPDFQNIQYVEGPVRRAHNLAAICEPIV